MIETATTGGHPSDTLDMAPVLYINRAVFIMVCVSVAGQVLEPDITCADDREYLCLCLQNVSQSNDACGATFGSILLLSRDGKVPKIVFSHGNYCSI